MNFRPFAHPVLATVMLLAAGLVSAQTAPAAAAPPAVAPTPGLAAPAAQPLPAARWTVEQIRQAFTLADANSDGRLTRAEAQRLALLPISFEDADRNKDGVLDLAEYQTSFGQ